MNDVIESEPSRSRAGVPSDDPRVGAWAFLPVGIVAAALGLAPWWLSGARLPVQNLWASPVAPDAMPTALLPFSQYAVIQIFSLLIVGAAAAGIAGRALRVRGWGLVLLMLGVLSVQVGATARTSIVVREGLQDRLESTLYLGGLIAGTGLSILVGVLVTVLIARAPRAGALLGLAVGAIGMASWVGSLLDPSRIGESPLTPLLVVVPWIPPVLTGIAIAWAGLNTAGRVIAALVAVGLMWIAPAVTTALTSALGSRVLLDSGGSDAIDQGARVFQMALLSPELALRPILATVIAAGIAFGVRAVVGRRNATASTGVP